MGWSVSRYSRSLHSSPPFFESGPTSFRRLEPLLPSFFALEFHGVCLAFAVDPDRVGGSLSHSGSVCFTFQKRRPLSPPNPNDRVRYTLPLAVFPGHALSGHIPICLRTEQVKQSTPAAHQSGRVLAADRRFRRDNLPPHRVMKPNRSFPQRSLRESRTGSNRSLVVSLFVAAAKAETEAFIPE